MELERIRRFVQEHSAGVVIRMIDGTSYRIPHRDYITFGPPKLTTKGELIAAGTSFLVFEGEGLESMRLVNALLVADISPIKANGNGQSGRGRGRKTKR